MTFQRRFTDEDHKTAEIAPGVFVPCTEDNRDWRRLTDDEKAAVKAFAPETATS